MQSSAALQMKLASENSFVIVTDLATRKQTSAWQLPVPTHAVGDTLYAPLLYFLPIFNSISQTELAVDTAREISLSGFDSTGKSETFRHFKALQWKAGRTAILFAFIQRRRSMMRNRFVRDENWLYVTLPNVRADTSALNAITLNPVVEQMLAVQSPTSAQISFKLRKKISTTGNCPG